MDVLLLQEFAAKPSGGKVAKSTQISIHEKNQAEVFLDHIRAGQRIFTRLVKLKRYHPETWKSKCRRILAEEREHRIQQSHEDRTRDLPKWTPHPDTMNKYRKFVRRKIKEYHTGTIKDGDARNLERHFQDFNPEETEPKTDGRQDMQSIADELKKELRLFRDPTGQIQHTMYQLVQLQEGSALLDTCKLHFLLTLWATRFISDSAGVQRSWCTVIPNPTPLPTKSTSTPRPPPELRPSIIQHIGQQSIHASPNQVATGQTPTSEIEQLRDPLSAISQNFTSISINRESPSKTNTETKDLPTASQGLLHNLSTIRPGFNNPIQRNQRPRRDPIFLTPSRPPPQRFHAPQEDAESVHTAFIDDELGGPEWEPGARDTADCDRRLERIRDFKANIAQHMPGLGEAFAEFLLPNAADCVEDDASKQVGYVLSDDLDTLHYPHRHPTIYPEKIRRPWFETRLPRPEMYSFLDILDIHHPHLPELPGLAILHSEVLREVVDRVGQNHAESGQRLQKLISSLAVHGPYSVSPWRTPEFGATAILMPLDSEFLAQPPQKSAAPFSHSTWSSASTTTIGGPNFIIICLAPWRRASNVETDQPLDTDRFFETDQPLDTDRFFENMKLYAINIGDIFQIPPGYAYRTLATTSCVMSYNSVLAVRSLGRSIRIWLEQLCAPCHSPDTSTDQGRDLILLVDSLRKIIVTRSIPTTPFACDWEQLQLRLRSTSEP